jgi:exodeoxyribonuclease V alpha subunit
VNELGGFLASHPWAQDLGESDRLVVESLMRAAPDLVDGDLSAEDDFLTLLIALAGAVRIEHAAVALEDRELAALLETLDLPSDLVTAVQRGACAETSLARRLCVRVTLDEPITASGRPILIADVAGRPAFAHLRRWAFHESRLAHGLAAAMQETTGRGSGRISVVTGGPGTGKTTSVAHLLQTWVLTSAVPVTVALCAPTARAASRLLESVTASGALSSGPLVLDGGSGSVHHLLGRRPDRPGPTRPLDPDVIVIDEASMIDLGLLDEVVHRARADARIVLVGDADQLASVNVGAALRDVVAAAELPRSGLVTRLTVNHRFDPVIALAADAAKVGDLDGLRAIAAAHPDVVQIEPDRERALDRARHCADERSVAAELDPTTAVEALGRYIVLCATREGRGSVAWWSSRLARDTDGGRSRWTPGTPVLITRNEAALSRDDRLHNGDVGVALGGDRAGWVGFPGGAGPRLRMWTSLPRCEAAWALTIHKSQGSEYDEVLVSLPDRDSGILTRELLYTALTRARRTVTVVGPTSVLEAAFARRVSRVSALAERVAALTATSAGRPA